MCGFAGFLAATPRADAEALARRMAATLQHRGPDDEGTWAADGVALGFRRLSILDLTPEGHQPMQAGRYTVVFNGEIYNFAALRAELEPLGHTFRGHSDTEVLLAAIAQWGFEATLPRLWGMFAIALWDAQERTLFLARDRVGKKPLYYGVQRGTLLFGSELKALRAHPDFEDALDHDALAAYLRFLYVPGPHSAYRGISKLPAGTWLAVRPGQAPGTPRAYWDARTVARADRLHLSPEDATERLEALLTDAVKLRMVADVPVGAFLSGGLDSSTVVALMRKQSSRVRTFTIGSTVAEYDESEPARAVAKHLGTEHTELLVSPEEARAVIPELPRIWDEPFADTSQVPTLLVSRLARQSVTVALSGDGGDELFGGYHRYLSGPRLWNVLRWIPRPALQTLARGIRKVPPHLWQHLHEVLTGNRVHKLSTVLEQPDLRAIYLRLVSTWEDPAQLLLQGREPAPLAGEDAAWSLEAAHAMMLLDLRTYLSDDILVKVDRASMAASLEARAPLLDHRVIEFAWQLGLEHKIEGGQGKRVLRRVLLKHVPAALVDRPKRGFGLPLDAWLRGPLRPWAEDLLSPASLERTGVLRHAPLRAALDEHARGSASRTYQLWAALMLQAWLLERRA